MHEQLSGLAAFLRTVEARYRRASALIGIASIGAANVSRVTVGSPDQLDAYRTDVNGLHLECEF
jgi:hypothetical protein